MTLRTMMTAVSGLRAEGDAIGVVGDNIANVSTYGFKRQRSSFEDILGRSAFSNGAGSGVRNAQVRQEYTQGSVVVTGVSTDLALTGDGFFAVEGAVNGLSGVFYSRGGNFAIDADGYLVNSSRMRLLGYASNVDGTYQAGVQPLRVPTGAIPANPTTTAQITANLDSSTPVAATPWSVSDPSSTASFSTTMTVYDSLGASHSMDVYFSKTAAGAWEYHVTVAASETSLSVAAAGDEYVEVGGGTLEFDETGALVADDVDTEITPAFLNAADQTIALDFGNSMAEGFSGLDGVTQFSSTSNVSSQSQNGYSSGALSDVSIDSDGTVFGQYSNGESVAVGKIAIAKFRANEGLVRAGDTLWRDTEESGQAALGTAATGGRGAISSGAVESSNVDMAQEMVELIRHQRSYGANSRAITTADDMLAELMTLKK